MNFDFDSSYAAFVPEVGTAEFFLMLESPEAIEFPQALDLLQSRYQNFLDLMKLTDKEIAFSRIYLSDIANQEPRFTTSPFYHRLSLGAVSVIGQRALNKGPLTLFAYFATPFQDKLLRNVHYGKTLLHNEALLTGKHYRMLWLANYVSGEAQVPESQMEDILKQATLALDDHGMQWLPNALRSWIFVRDIDNHYEAMVKARREFFHQHGLTERTRYLASTGIEGRFANPESWVGMDLLCLDGLDPAQITQMEAPEYLSPASQYGVTFERGLRIDFGDRTHLHLSGTASIGINGELLHPGNVEMQTERTLENLQALLCAQGSSFSDLAYVLVYLRDPTSEFQVRQELQRRLPPDLPRLFLEASVCRPGWLVEIEGLAILPYHSHFPPFF